VILVVSTCRLPLSEEEFVRPVVEVLRGRGLSCEVKSYRERLDFSAYTKVIICGTALMDLDYLNYLDNFEALLDYDGGVLGICAGYQILALLFGGRLEEALKIGVYRVRVVRPNPLTREGDFGAYFLHNYAVTEASGKVEPLAVQGGEICMFKVLGREFYATSFHPEVQNRDIIEKFALLE